MSTKLYKWAQQRLSDAGFDPQGIDGIWGRNTIKALKGFQKSHGLAQNGMLDTATIEALRLRVFLPDDPTPPQDNYATCPWMATAKSKMGFLETEKRTKDFLKSDGPTLGDPSKLPWCGDFVETCIAVTMPDEALPVNPYLARNWTKFGVHVDPCFGAVVVFKRPGSKTNGHVAFYVGEDAKNYYVLGGNQSNKVSITKIAKSRLLDSRYPLTFKGVRPDKVFMNLAGKTSTNEA